MSDLWRRMLNPLRRKIVNAIGRGIVRSLDDSGPVRFMQITGRAGETLNRVEHVQPYGFYANELLDGVHTVFVCPGGERDHVIAVVVGNRKFRITALAGGEVCIATDEDEDANKHRIHLKRGRKIEIYCDELTAQIAGPAQVTATGDVTVQGANVIVKGTTSVKLGPSGAAAAGVARIGDQVDPVTHLITGGSTTVQADG